jgi:large repetitive protein
MHFSRVLPLVVGTALLAACGDDDTGPSNTAPTVTFTAQCTALGCSFSNGSTDADGTLEAYAWDFGDEGASATTRDATHTYARPGNFTVTLTVTDDDGDEATATAPVKVTAPPDPGGDFPATFSVSCVYLTCDFIDRSMAGPYASFTWTFGDNSEASTSRDANHVYTAEGQFQVTLLIVDGRKHATTSQTIRVELLNPSPSAHFIYSCADLACEFTDRSTDQVGGVAGYYWDFGDGQTSTDRNPSHTFPGAGPYQIELTVTDTRGAGATASVTFTLPATDWPSAELKVDCYYSQCVFQTVGTGGSIVAWQWSFGDGGVSTEEAPVYTYLVPGTYTAQVTISGPGGGSTTLTRELTVPFPGPQAAFTPDCHRSTCTFTNESTGQSLYWIWQFGDGTRSDDQSPTHVYEVTEPTTFTVSLKVWNWLDEEDVVSHEVTVAPPE